MFPSRLSSAGYLPKKVGDWIYKSAEATNNFAVSIVLKAMEGIVEAGPQLTLQL